MKRLIAIFIFTIVFSSYSFAETEEGNVMDYKNSVETEISGYSRDYRGNVKSFGYNVPLKIHYNDTYKTYSGYDINVDEFVVTDGVPALKVTINTESGGDRASYKITIRCYTSEDIYTDIGTEGLGYLLSAGAYQVEDELLSSIKADDFLTKNEVKSIEVWIDECDYT